MFFVISSGEAYLSNRQLCGIESASNVNPRMVMVMVFVHPAKRISLEKSPALTELLQQRPNIQLATLDPVTVMHGVGLDRLLDSILSGKFPMVHMSDILRMLLLLKFGGVYSDLDMIMLKNLRSVVPSDNFMLAETNHYFAACLFGFQRNHKTVGR
jgi:lactosylceramide 4-alpha-galactosyltransferase